MDAEIILGLGQSGMAKGSVTCAPAIDVLPIYANSMMFAQCGLRGMQGEDITTRDLTQVCSARESYAQSYFTSADAQLRLYETSNGILPPTRLFMNAAWGGTSYDMIAPGTRPWDNCLAGLVAAKAHFGGVTLKAMLIDSGESSRDWTESAVIDWFRGFYDAAQADFKAITGQGTDIPLFLMQTPINRLHETQGLGVMDGQMALHLDYRAGGRKIILAGPRHHRSYGDNYHPNGPASRWSGGETFGAAMVGEFYRGGHDPLRVTSASIVGDIVVCQTNAVQPLEVFTTPDVPMATYMGVMLHHPSGAGRTQVNQGVAGTTIRIRPTSAPQPDWYGRVAGSSWLNPSRTGPGIWCNIREATDTVHAVSPSTAMHRYLCGGRFALV